MQSLVSEGVSVSACIERWSKINGPTNQWIDRLTNWNTNKVMDRQTDEPTNWWTNLTNRWVNGPTNWWAIQCTNWQYLSYEETNLEIGLLTGGEGRSVFEPVRNSLHEQKTMTLSTDQQLSYRGLVWSIFAMGWEGNSNLTLIFSWFWFFQSNFKVNPPMTRLC